MCIHRGEYRDGTWGYRSGSRRAKTQLELKIARDLEKKKASRVMLISKVGLKKMYPPHPNTSVIIYLERADRVSWTFDLIFGLSFCW